jgi:hypothetical protein
MKFKVGDIVKSKKTQRVYQVISLLTYRNAFEGKILENPLFDEEIGRIRPVRDDVCDLISPKGHPNTNLFK